ncbi:unnamed protein product [Caretta caretta]
MPTISSNGTIKIQHEESTETRINPALGILEICCHHSTCNSQQLNFEMKCMAGQHHLKFKKACYSFRSCCTICSGILALRASFGQEIVLLKLPFNPVSLRTPAVWLPATSYSLLFLAITILLLGNFSLGMYFCCFVF